MTLFELNLPKKYEKEYLSLMLDGLVRRIKTANELIDDAKRVLIPNYETKDEDYSFLTLLLIDEPEGLFELNSKLDSELKKLGVSNSTIEKVFGYEQIFNTSTKSKAYKLAIKIGAHTCCYCNRQYTFTVVKDGNQNKYDRITRPAFDHWFPKSKYPLLSISLYNLIPSCTICNSSAKGDHNVNLRDYVHPYVHRLGHPRIKFVAEPATELDRKWTIKIERNENSPEDNTIKMFYLDEIYKEHDKLELKDLMDFRDNYPDGYLKELITVLENAQIDTSSLSRKDVYRMLFGVEWDDDKHLDRPFGKMKNDILKEILG